jgi:mono/diheme cytochrome c family protein
MHVATWKKIRLSRFIATAFFTVALVLTPARSHISAAQEAKKANAGPQAQEAGPVSRGQYIVEDVAMCGTCHTPRKPNGELDRSRWLAGAPVPYLPAHRDPNWPLQAPRLAGLPPTTDAGMITLLTTAIWTDGKPLRDPMPKFHMTRADAEAVLAYLKSISPRR